MQLLERGLGRSFGSPQSGLPVSKQAWTDAMLLAEGYAGEVTCVVLIQKALGLGASENLSWHGVLGLNPGRLAYFEL